MLAPGLFGNSFQVKVKFVIEMHPSVAHIVQLRLEKHHQAITNAFLPIRNAEENLMPVAI
jgi:hypothetical protein